MSHQFDLLDECLRMARVFDPSLPVNGGQPKHRTRRRRREPSVAVPAGIPTESAFLVPPEFREETPPVQFGVLDLVSRAFRIQLQFVRPECRLGRWCVEERGPDLHEDALDRIHLVILLQERFEQSFKDQMIERWATVGDIVQFLEGSA